MVRLIAGVAGLLFTAWGLWAMLAPASFYEAAAVFPPYNQHFLQDIGAFQIGLGAVLLLALVPRLAAAGLAVALLGVGIGSTAHLVSHLVGTDLGGAPARDIPFFAVLSVALLWAGVAAARKGDAAR